MGEGVVFREAFPLAILTLTAFILGCAASSREVVEDWHGARITGVLWDQSGRPLQGGYVYAYGGSRANILGPADAMSENTKPDGIYELILPAGEYRIVARKRISGAIGGPLRNGDLTGSRKGTVTVDSQGVSGIDIDLRVFEEGRDADPARIISTDTVVTGTVLDEAGNPVAGAHAFAYSGEFRMDPPDFLSKATGQDGRFTLNLPGEGIYTVGARTGYRGRPRKGDLVGFWGNSKKPREISEGITVDGVTLVLKAYEEREDGI